MTEPYNLHDLLILTGEQALQIRILTEYKNEASKELSKLRCELWNTKRELSKAQGSLVLPENMPEEFKELYPHVYQDILDELEEQNESRDDDEGNAN